MTDQEFSAYCRRFEDRMAEISGRDDRKRAEAQAKVEAAWQAASENGSGPDHAQAVFETVCALVVLTVVAGFWTLFAAALIKFVF
jgi:hypothetical protein